MSRPDAVRETVLGVTATLASFKFLGLSVPVDLKYNPASSAELSMRNGTGTNGDGGDVYTGLDRFGRLVETVWKAGSTVLVNTTYGRNRVGGVRWQNNVPASTTEPNFYWYDGLQQNYQHQRGLLSGIAPNYTGITNTQQSEGFSFDETGNWLSGTTTSPVLSQTRTHNKANEIATLTGPTGVIAPVFSAVGNMTTMPKPGAWGTSCALVWDAWNRLVTFNDGSSTTTNKYDALSRRIQKSLTTPLETRDYYYDRQWRTLQENFNGAGSGTVRAQYVWSPFDRWTMIRRKRTVNAPLDEIRFVLKDYLDPSAVITTAGAVDERFSYDAFGPVRFLNSSFTEHAASTCDWNFLFHAEFRDVDSGLYNYGYRFYDPSVGRWISRDPLQEKGGLNLYRLALNNAILNLDVLGLSCTEDKVNSPTVEVFDALGNPYNQKNRKGKLEVKEHHVQPEPEFPREVQGPSEIDVGKGLATFMKLIQRGSVLGYITAKICAKYQCCECDPATGEMKLTAEKEECVWVSSPSTPQNTDDHSMFKVDSKEGAADFGQALAQTREELAKKLENSICGKNSGGST